MTTAPPTQGLTAWFRGKGFGDVEPSEVFLGGDPTGDVKSIAWQSWGGPQTTGAGTGFYLPAGQVTAQASEAQAIIVAFDLGSYGGHPAYQEVE